MARPDDLSRLGGVRLTVDAHRSALGSAFASPEAFDPQELTAIIEARFQATTATLPA